MMMPETAKASTTINAPADKVWQALIDPAAIKQYMFGTTVTSDWREGSPITWKGEFNGKPYEDHGTIKKVDAPRRLEYSHASGNDSHDIIITLAPDGNATRVDLSQTNNATADARKESEKNWGMMLSSMKQMLEK